MPLIPWAFALANLKRDLGLVWGWLSHASFWQLTTLGLGLWMVVVQFQLADARHDAAAYEKQYLTVKSELQKVSTAKNEQKVETREKIKVVLQKQRAADDRAKKIEQAPLSGDCKTPREVRDADI